MNKRFNISDIRNLHYFSNLSFSIKMLVTPYNKAFLIKDETLRLDSLFSHFCRGLFVSCLWIC